MQKKKMTGNVRKKRRKHIDMLPSITHDRQFVVGGGRGNHEKFINRAHTQQRVATGPEQKAQNTAGSSSSSGSRSNLIQLLNNGKQAASGRGRSPLGLRAGR